MKLLFLACILIFPVVSYSQQSAAQVSQCQSILSKIELRGFRLGMTAAAIRRKYPEIKIPRPDSFGYARTDGYFIVTKTASMRRVTSKVIDKYKYPAFEGLRTVSLEFVDNKLASFTFSYETGVQWNSVSEFAYNISRKIGLLSPWEFEQKNDKSMGKILCDDYGIVVLMDDEANSMMSIADRKLYGLRNKRSNDYDDFLNGLEEKKKTEFKP